MEVCIMRFIDATLQEKHKNGLFSVLIVFLAKNGNKYNFGTVTIYLLAYGK